MLGLLRKLLGEDPKHIAQRERMHNQLVANRELIKRIRTYSPEQILEYAKENVGSLTPGEICAVYGRTIESILTRQKYSVHPQIYLSNAQDTEGTRLGRATQAEMDVAVICGDLLMPSLDMAYEEAIIHLTRQGKHSLARYHIHELLPDEDPTQETLGRELVIVEQKRLPSSNTKSRVKIYDPALLRMLDGPISALNGFTGLEFQIKQMYDQK